MSKKEQDSIFGDIVASSITLAKANTIRSLIINNIVGHYVFVFKNKTGKYDVGVQNEWGGKLSKDGLEEIKTLLKKSKKDE